VSLSLRCDFHLDSFPAGPIETGERFAAEIAEVIERLYGVVATPLDRPGWSFETKAVVRSMQQQLLAAEPKIDWLPERDLEAMQSIVDRNPPLD